MESVEYRVQPRAAGLETVVGCEDIDETSVYPASTVQRQFWLLHQLAPNSAAYNIGYAFRFAGHLNISAFHRSLQTIIDRHEVFRTTFATRDSRLVQVVRHRVPIDVPLIDLADLTAGQADAAVSETVHAELARPFDLSTGPLLRALLLRRLPQEHVFVLAMHHIITDLHTMNGFFRELTTLYDAHCVGAPCPLERPAHHYSEYAMWEQQWLPGEQASAMLSYWEQQLRGREALLSLPTDRPRPATQSMKGQEIPLRLSCSLTSDLKQFSRGAGIPLFVTLLSAYAVLLHRYSGQASVTVGVPFTNRRRSEFQDVMGCFVNILPIHIDLSGDPSFREVTRRVRQAMLAAHRCQEVTVERIVERLKLTRNLSYNPLYQVGITYSPPIDFQLPGLAVEPLGAHTSGSQLDLFASLWEADGQVRGRMEFSTDLFEQTTVERFIGHYETLLRSVTEDADRSILAMPILPENERIRLLSEWNATEMACPDGSGIHHLFEAQVQRTPHATAVVSDDAQLTYRELNERANRLARVLRNLGVAADGMAGIYLERSSEMLVGLMGILKAGGAYLPLDPDFPRERIEYMLEHSGVSVLLTQERLKAQLPKTSARLLCLDTDWPWISQQSERNLGLRTGPDDLAYVIYTSGSTGKPKGVQIPHRAAVNFLISMQQEPGMTADDVLLAVTTPSFDISVLELFLPLTVGARMVIARREAAADGKQILEAIRRHHVTVMQATPATWRLMIAAGWQGPSDLKVLCGGEAMPADLARALWERAASVWNMYGPTETTVWSTCYHLRGADDRILIGRPIANTQVYILDAFLQPVPIGVPGEIYIGGAGVTRGYLKDPERTAERFLADPFAKRVGARMYRTGDFGRFLSDGNIEFLGRIDSQVKVRGFRIELGEVETALVQHPQVREAAVTTRQDTAGNTRLVGYVVPVDGERPTVESLRGFLRDRLPYYMVPELYVTLPSLPLTPNEKVDRKALPEPDYARPEMTQSYVCPSTALEKTLSDVWCRVLGLDRAGINDNFFDLGGNSLLSIQATVRMREALGIEVPVVALFQYPTIAALARHLGRDNPQATSFARVADDRAGQRRAILASRRRSVRNGRR